MKRYKKVLSVFLFFIITFVNAFYAAYADETVPVETERVNTEMLDIIKVGVFNQDTKTIDWTVTINSKEIAVENAVLYINTNTKNDGFLTLKEGTVQITEDGQDISKNKIDENNYSITIGEFSKQKVIKFTTDINQSFFDNNHIYNCCFDIGVNISWNLKDDNNTLYNSNAKYINQDAQPKGKSIIIKDEFNNYDHIHGIITWQVTVNSNKSELENVILTDILSGGQTLYGVYKDDTAKEKYDNYKQVDDKVEINLGGFKDEKVLFIKTKAPFEDLNSNKDILYRNNAEVKADKGIKDIVKVVVYSDVDNEMINLSGRYYTQTHKNRWTATINKDNVNLPNAVFSVDIPRNSEYVNGSFQINQGFSPENVEYTKSEDDETKSGTLTYKFKDHLDKCIEINYETKVTEPSIYYSNGCREITNKAVLSFANNKAESLCTVNFNVQVISHVNYGDTQSTGQPTNKWILAVNEDHTLINDGMINGKITTKQESGNEISNPLVVDASDMKLTEYNMVDGIEDEGVEVEIRKDMFTYDNNKKEFTLMLPKKADNTSKYVFDYTLKDTSMKYKQYTISSDIEFICTNDNRVPQSDNRTVGVDYLSFKKRVEEYNKTITVICSDDSGKAISNEVFELYDKVGTLLMTKTTDEDGKAVFEGLTKDGKYTIKQVKVPEGYELNKEPYVVTASDEDTKYLVTNKKNTVDSGSDTKDDSNKETDSIQQPVKKEIGKLTIVNYDSDNKGKNLSGSEFELKDNGGKVIRTGITDKDGRILWDNIEYGDYTVLEKSAPNGYIINKNFKSVTIGSESTECEFTNKKVHDSSSVSSGGNGSSSADSNIPVSSPSKPYKPAVGNITINNVDAENKERYLTGAEFVLKDDCGNVIKTATTDICGLISWNDIPCGTYKVSEVSASKGYVIDDKDKLITVSADSLNNQIKFENSRIYAEIDLCTVLRGRHDFRIKGALFAIFSRDDIDFSMPLRTAESDDNGIVRFTAMNVGDYVIKEIKAATGYKLSDTVITAKVTDNIKTLGQVINADTYEFDNDESKGSITVINKSSDGALLKGALFNLIDSYGNIIACKAVDDSGEIIWENLNFGLYGINEITPPDGYLLDSAGKSAMISTDNSEAEVIFVNIKAPQKVDDNIIINNDDKENNHDEDKANGISDKQDDKKRQDTNSVVEQFKPSNQESNDNHIVINKNEKDKTITKNSSGDKVPSNKIKNILIINEVNENKLSINKEDAEKRKMIMPKTGSAIGLPLLLWTSVLLISAGIILVVIRYKREKAIK